MIHTNRIVTVGEQESIIDRPIVLYRGDREVEIEFTLVGNEFTFSEEGNVIKSVNASHGQLVLNTPSGEHMFSELAECHEGKVVFVVTKEMIDEFIEMGFYSFQIRLYDSAEMKSRVTIPPVTNGFDIRNPIAAEDETNVVDQGIVDYARIFKDQSNEELPTFDWTGAYNKTEWVHHDVITENKMNKIEDALYSINANIKESDVVMLNALDNVKKDADKYVKEHMAEIKQDVEEFERNLNTDVQQFKIDTNVEYERFTKYIYEAATIDGAVNVRSFGAVGNNTTDDTAAFQQAIDYAIANNKKIIYIPTGKYLVTQTLNISGNPQCWFKRIMGEGQGGDRRGAQINYQGEGCLFNVDLRYSVGGWRNVHFSDLTISGNGNNDGVKLIFTQQALFDNMYFSNFRNAFAGTGDSHYPYFRNCQFVSNKTAIHTITSDDERYVAGGCNNGKIDNCFFTYCDIPIDLRGSGSEWTIINTDIEGYNGCTYLTSSNRMVNCRIERNNMDETWMQIEGSGNTIDVNTHGVGSGVSTIPFKIIVNGDRNTIKGNFGYLIHAILDNGANNKFYINTTNGGYDTSSVYVLKPGSFIFNNHDTKINYNAIWSKGERGRDIGGAYITHPLYNTEHRLTNASDTNYSRYTFAVRGNTANTVVFSGCDLYLEGGTIGRGAGITLFGSLPPLTYRNEWRTIIIVRYETEALSDHTGAVIQSAAENLPSFTVANPFVSTLHPPVRYVKFGDHNNQEESNFENNTFVTNMLMNGRVSSPVMWDDSFSDINVIYKNNIFKNNKDEFGNTKVIKTSHSGCLPLDSLMCLVEGRGLGKYLSCVLQREETSSNYTVISKTAIGCDITFANKVGTLGGTDLNGMEFTVTVYK